jgi:exonuclease VII large subunit
VDVKFWCHSQERSKLKEELEDLRRRLHRAEKEVLEAKEECIQMHSTNQALEKEVLCDQRIAKVKHNFQIIKSLNDEITHREKGRLPSCCN